MTAVNFPDSPTVGQSFSSNGKTWVWDGSIWGLRVASASRDAYDIAVDNGFVGTEAEWLDSLVGADGAAGPAGADGVPGADGPAGSDGADGAPYGNIDGGKANSNFGGTITVVQGGSAGSF